MYFQCSRVSANFPTEKLCLENEAAARMIWAEHGGTFVLRILGLAVLEAPELLGEAGIELAAALPEAEALARQIEGFAGEHGLRLGPEPPGAELSETPVLAACHVPGKNLFIFCEDARLTARLKGSQLLEMLISGSFKARRVPCQETDVVIHLDMAAMSRLLAGLLAWSRQSQ